jgi:hypothetical protein
MFDSVRIAFFTDREYSIKDCYCSWTKTFHKLEK